MSSKIAQHDEQHLDLVFLYALRGLPPNEIPVVEATITACAQCQEELESLQPVIASFVSWPTDVLRPSVPLWGRLAQRIAKETGTSPIAEPSHVSQQPKWEEAAPGISVKLLSTDTANDRVSMLVRLAPGTDYPPHRHSGVEELHLLHGELIIDDKKLHPGDYVRADADSVDHRVWSETGCTCFLLTSVNDELL